MFSMFSIPKILNRIFTFNLYSYLFLAFFISLFPSIVQASNYPFDENVNMKVGIGTSMIANAGLTVMTGNVGIGTWNPAGALDIKTGNNVLVESGNVGINSLSPGQLLDVQGTVRDLGEVIGAGGITLGGVTNTSWASAGTNYWNYTAAGNIGVSTTQAVGIGTTFIGGNGEAALSVMNGNVGIGTWAPNSSLAITSNANTGSLVINAAAGPNQDILDVYRGGSDVVYVDQYGNLTPARVDTSTIVSVGTLTLYGGNSGFPFDIIDLTCWSGNCNVTPTSGTEIAVNAFVDFDPTSGSATFANLESSPTINQTGGANGITRGIYVNPIVTAAADFRALETSVGNVGIGTISGNLGIGSQWPGQRLDVQGTVRALYFSGNGSGLTNVSGTNYWNYSASGNVGVSTIQAVGIGTTFIGGTGEAALSVMNGNVGIGTWAPRGTLDVEGTLSTAYFAGNVGIGTWVPAALLDVGGGKFKVDSAGDILGVFGTWNQYGALSTSAIGLSGGINIGGSIYFTNTSSLGWSSTNSSYGPVDIGLSRLSAGILGVGNGTAGDYSGTLTATNVGIGTFNVTGGSLIVKTGNVGIGSLTPGQALDVKGTIRTTNFTMTGQTPLVGYVLTASDTAGDATWSSAGGIAGWTVSGGNVYTTTGSNNVGIGTSTPQGGLVVTNGNVGIGTWVPVSALHISQNTGITWNGFGPPINTATLTIGAVGSSNSASLFVNTGAVSGSYPTGFGIDGNTTGVSGLNDTVVNLKAYSYQYGGDGGALAFWTSNGPAIAEKMRLDSNGNLGIGSTAPGQMLDVQGSLRILGNGSVGIGTAFIGGTGEAALTVMSGNVGIGTWVPATSMDVNGQYRAIQYTTTVTLNWNNGNVQYIQLASASQTFTFANPQGGARYMLILKQPSSGAAGTVIWPANVYFPGDTPPTLTGTNSKTDIITFIYDSVNAKYYGGSSLNY